MQGYVHVCVHCTVKADELCVRVCLCVCMCLWAGAGGGREGVVVVVDWLVDRCSDWQLMAFPVLPW